MSTRANIIKGPSLDELKRSLSDEDNKNRTVALFTYEVPGDYVVRKEVLVWIDMLHRVDRRTTEWVFRGNSVNGHSDPPHIVHGRYNTHTKSGEIQIED
ncbi:MAG: hypothetical protein Q7S10_03995 [bacterium]|nr:hypothetical protein [bacterium]